MASILKVDKLDPQSGTALEIGSSGDTITIPSGATFTQSGTMNASAITAGTIATARLGSGTASSSTVLYGDQTYKAEPGGGKFLQRTASTYATQMCTTSTSLATTNLSVDMTMTLATSLIYTQFFMSVEATSGPLHLRFYNDGVAGNNYVRYMKEEQQVLTGWWISDPDTTDEQTQELYFASQDGNSVCIHANNLTSFIEAWEIGTT
jgi:hypothetical protein